jgi:hypothetical protein
VKRTVQSPSLIVIVLILLIMIVVQVVSVFVMNVYSLILLYVFLFVEERLLLLARENENLLADSERATVRFVLIKEEGQLHDALVDLKVRERIARSAMTAGMMAGVTGDDLTLLVEEVEESLVMSRLVAVQLLQLTAFERVMLEMAEVDGPIIFDVDDSTGDKLRRLQQLNEKRALELENVYIDWEVN